MGKTIQSGITGDKGEALASLLLSEIAYVNRYQKDIGLDLHCELRDNSSIEFYVQAKGSENPTYTDKSIKSLPIVCKTIEDYWLKKQHPVFILMSDTYYEKTYYLLIDKNTYKPKKEGQKSITFDIPLSNEITKENIGAFVKEVVENQPSISKKEAQEYLDEYSNKHPLLFHNLDEINSLLEFMRSSDQDEQVQAKLVIKKLYEDKKLNSRRLIEGLISIFTDCKDRITQSHVLDALVYLDVKEIIPEIPKQIERNLMLFEYRETPEQLRHVYTDFLFNVLVKLKANTIYPSIKHLLGYNDEFLTRGVIRTCGELNIKESVSDVLTFLKHPKIEIREEAGRALSKMDEKVITKELKRILEYSANDNEVSGAIYVFAIKKDKSVEDKVITFANSPNRDVRKSVALYLGEINSVKKISLLLDLVIDPDNEVRNEAVRSVVNKLTLPNKEKEGLALPLLKKTYEEKRIQRVNSLLSIINRCGSEKSIPILLEIYRNEKGETHNFRWIDYEKEMEYFQQVNLKTNALEILKRFDIQEIQDDIIKEIREAEDDSKIKYIIAAGEMKIAAAFNEITNLLEQGYTMWSNFIPSTLLKIDDYKAKNWSVETLKNNPRLELCFTCFEILYKSSINRDIKNLIKDQIIRLMRIKENRSNTRLLLYVEIYKVNEAISLIIDDIMRDGLNSDLLYDRLNILAKLKTEESRDLLIEILAKVDDSLKRIIIGWLGHIGDKKCIDTIRNYENYPDLDIRKEAIAIIKN